MQNICLMILTFENHLITTEFPFSLFRGPTIGPIYDVIGLCFDLTNISIFLKKIVAIGSNIFMTIKFYSLTIYPSSLQRLITMAVNVFAATFFFIASSMLLLHMQRKDFQ